MKALKPILLGLTALGILLFLLSFGIDGLASIRWIALVVGIAAYSLQSENRIARAACGTAVLAVLIFFITEIISNTSIGRKNIDLTEDDRFTLTDGTKAILAELEDPVIINYYVTRDIEGSSADVKRYIPRIDNFLEEITSLAKNDNITLNFIDPQPNTDEEDAAVLDEISIAQAGENGRLFFGASISSLDKKKVIPYFNPQTETQLEYDVMSAIAEVTVRNRPVVGLVTPLNLTTGGQSRKGAAIYNELRSSREVALLGMGIVDNLEMVYKANEWGDAPGYLDPERIPVVLVVHPAGITPEAEFALDQYLLRGGNVIACIDSFSAAARQTAQQPQFPGMPPQGGVPLSSSLPKLFEKHGIVTSGAEILIDPKYAVQNPMVAIYNKEAMQLEDDVTLASIQNLVFYTPSAFTSIEAKGLEISRLLKSSDRSDFITESVLTSTRNPQEILNNLRSNDKSYDLVVRLSGEFETAFPDGDPAAKAEDAEEEETDKPEKDEEKAEEAEEKEAVEESLKKGTTNGNLYLIADSDFLMDGIAYDSVQILTANGPQRTARPVSGNGPFILNIVDQANNSVHLIGARARTPIVRPLTVFKDMEADFQQTISEKVDVIQKELDEANRKLTELVQKRATEGRARFTAEETQFYFDAQKKRAAKEKEMRELQKELQTDVDAIKSGIFIKSLLIVPGLVVLIGIGVFISRRMSTQAR